MLVELVLNMYQTQSFLHPSHSNLQTYKGYNQWKPTIVLTLLVNIDPRYDALKPAYFPLVKKKQKNNFSSRCLGNCLVPIKTSTVWYFLLV